MSLLDLRFGPPPGKAVGMETRASSERKRDDGPVTNFSLILLAGALALAPITRAPLFAPAPPSQFIRSDGPVLNYAVLGKGAVAPPGTSLFEVRPGSPFLRDDGPVSNKSLFYATTATPPLKATLFDFARSSPFRDDGPVPGLLTVPGMGSTAGPAVTRAPLFPFTRSDPIRDDGPVLNKALAYASQAAVSPPFRAVLPEFLRSVQARDDGPRVNAALTYQVQPYVPFVGDADHVWSSPFRDDGPVINRALVYAPVQAAATFIPRALFFEKRNSDPYRGDGPVVNTIALGVGSTAGPAVTRAILTPDVHSQAIRDDGPVVNRAILYVAPPSVQTPFRAVLPDRARSEPFRDDGPKTNFALTYQVQLYAPYDGTLEPPFKRSEFVRSDGPTQNRSIYLPPAGAEPAAPAMTRAPGFAPRERSAFFRNDGPVQNTTLLVPGAEIPAEAPQRYTGHPNKHEISVDEVLGQWELLKLRKKTRDVVQPEPPATIEVQPQGYQEPLKLTIPEAASDFTDEEIIEIVLIALAAIDQEK